MHCALKRFALGTMHRAPTGFHLTHPESVFLTYINAPVLHPSPVERGQG